MAVRPRRYVAGLASVLVMGCAFWAVAEEWRPRHGLIPPSGVLNLGEIPPPQEVLLAGPEAPEGRAAWLAGLKQWRAERLTRMRYDGHEYERPELLWTRRVFSQNQMLVWERTFYDPDQRRYTVDRYLADFESRMGPLDAVLIWHVYPNLGVDERNSFDLLRDLPGGLPALKDVVEQFHRRGVKVFFPTLAWDTSTRPEGRPTPTALVEALKEIGADGINFDTLEAAPIEFRRAAEAAGHPLALEPQFAIRDESLQWSTLSWNDWVTWEDLAYPFVPMVNKTRWLEPRHMVDVTDRFTRDKRNSLQHAFFNGVGYATMENLWGFWYAMTPHDAEAVNRIARIERAFAAELTSPDWEPHAPTVQPGVFASRFPSAARTLWTVVNRNEYAVAGAQLRLPEAAGTRYYDLWRGAELQPAVDAGMATLSFGIEGLGFGAVLATRETPLPGPVQAVMDYMAERAARPLGSYSREWKALPQTMVEIPKTKPTAALPEGMVRIPGGDYDFVVRGIEIEGGNDAGVDVQYPWEDSPRRHHRRQMKIDSFFIDRTAVTNAEFKRFLDATGYRPADDHNFLRDWKEGTYPEGWARKPVTWVSIEDARAYAAWAGKRLPHEWEWQYAAQSADGRVYPWGNDWSPATVPVPDRGPSRRPPADVDAFPRGASPFGALDMAGNVSQWTDEFRDDHTRAAVIRGAAAYQPLGSVWYFPQTYRLDEHQKYLLMSPGRDRAGTIGFRLVVDARQEGSR